MRRALLYSLVLFSSYASLAAVERGFVPIFDGKTLDGWKLMDRNGLGYGVKDGVIFCQRGGGGNLFTEKEYENFILRFEFKLDHDSNNGIEIGRAHV